MIEKKNICKTYFDGKVTLIFLETEDIENFLLKKYKTYKKKYLFAAYR